MKDEKISNLQAVCMIIFFMVSTSSVFVRGIEAGKDAGLAVLIALGIAILSTLIYIQLIIHFPGKNLFEVCELCFGKYIGKIINIFFIYYLFVDIILTLRNLAQFINTTSLVGTPIFVHIIIMGLLSIWIVKQGLEVIGRWAAFFIIPLGIMTIMAILLFIPEMNINNIRPIAGEGFNKIMEGAFSVFSFPFGELIVFTMILKNFNNKKSYYKVFYYGMFFGGAIVLATTLTNILVIGAAYADIVYYPTFMTISLLNISFIERMEIIGAILYTLEGFVSISIYLLAICIGVSKVIKIKDYRLLTFPIGLIIINYTCSSFESRIEFQQWFGYWNYFAFPFQVIFPLIILIGVLIKKRDEFIN